MRSDIHAPASPLFDPEAYDLVDVFDLHHKSGDHRELSRILDTLAVEGIRQAPHSNGCGHCGQTNIRYVALLIHRAAKEWIFTGQDCLVARFDGQTRAGFLQLKRDAELARAKQAKKTAYLALCADSQALCFASYFGNISAALDDEAIRYSGIAWGLGTGQDIARKARSYGEATDRQLSLLDRLVAEQADKFDAYLVKQSARAAEPKAEALTEGRQVIEGVVLSVKENDGHYGVTYKILVKLDSGQRVYGTRPDSIWNVDKGDRVRFTAKVEPKDEEPDFAFYSRPTKAEILKAVAA